MSTTTTADPPPKDAEQAAVSDVSAASSAASTPRKPAKAADTTELTKYKKVAAKLLKEKKQMNAAVKSLREERDNARSEAESMKESHSLQVSALSDKLEKERSSHSDAKARLEQMAKENQRREDELRQQFTAAKQMLSQELERVTAENSALLTREKKSAADLTQACERVLVLEQSLDSKLRQESEKAKASDSLAQSFAALQSQMAELCSENEGLKQATDKLKSEKQSLQTRVDESETARDSAIRKADENASTNFAAKQKLEEALESSRSALQIASEELECLKSEKSTSSSAAVAEMHSGLKQLFESVKSARSELQSMRSEVSQSSEQFSTDSFAAALTAATRQCQMAQKKTDTLSHVLSATQKQLSESREKVHTSEALLQSVCERVDSCSLFQETVDTQTTAAVTSGGKRKRKRRRGKKGGKDTSATVSSTSSSASVTPPKTMSPETLSDAISQLLAAYSQLKEKCEALQTSATHKDESAVTGDKDAANAMKMKEEEIIQFRAQTEEFTATCETLERKMEALKTEHCAAIDKAKIEHENEVKVLKQEIVALEKKHAEELDKYSHLERQQSEDNGKLEEQLTALKNEKSASAKLRLELGNAKKALEELKQNSGESEQLLRDELQTSKATIEQLDASIKQLTAECERLSNEATVSSESATEKHASDLQGKVEELRALHQENAGLQSQLVKVRKELDDLQQTHMSEKQSMADKHSLAISQLTDHCAHEKQTEVAKLRESFERELETKRASDKQSEQSVTQQRVDALERSHSEERESLLSQLSELRSANGELEKRYGEVKSLLETAEKELAIAMAAAIAEKNTVTECVCELEAELAVLRRQSKQLSASLTTTNSESEALIASLRREVTELRSENDAFQSEKDAFIKSHTEAEGVAQSDLVALKQTHEKIVADSTTEKEALEQRIADLKSAMELEISQLETDKKAVESQLEDFQSRENELLKAKETQETENGKLQQSVADLTATNEKLTQELSKATEKREKLKKLCEQRAAALSGIGEVLAKCSYFLELRKRKSAAMPKSVAKGVSALVAAFDAEKQRHEEDFKALLQKLEGTRSMIADLKDAKLRLASDLHQANEQLAAANTAKKTAEQKLEELQRGWDQLEKDHVAVVEDRDNLKVELENKGQDASQHVEVEKLLEEASLKNEQLAAELASLKSAHEEDLGRQSQDLGSEKEFRQMLESKLESAKIEAESATRKLKKNEGRLEEMLQVLSQCSAFEVETKSASATPVAPNMESESAMSGRTDGSERESSCAETASKSAATGGSQQLMAKVTEVCGAYESLVSECSEAKQSVAKGETRIQKMAATLKKLAAIRGDLNGKLKKANGRIKEVSAEKSAFTEWSFSVANEVNRSLERWKSFCEDSADGGSAAVGGSATVSSQHSFVGGEAAANEKKQRDNVLSALRSLSMYFIQCLDMYRQSEESQKKASESTQLTVASLRKKASANEKEVGELRAKLLSVDSTESAKKSQLEALKAKNARMVAATHTHWHFQVSNAELMNLLVESRLKVAGIVWCLVKWTKCSSRKSKTEASTPESEEGSAESSGEEVFFWTTQECYLRKLKAKSEDEVYLPDFMENRWRKVERKECEAKQLSLQKRLERQMTELQMRNSDLAKQKSEVCEELAVYKQRAHKIVKQQKADFDAMQQSNEDKVATLNEESAKLSAHIAELQKQMEGLSAAEAGDEQLETSESKGVGMKDSKREFESSDSELATASSRLLAATGTGVRSLVESEKTKLILENALSELNAKKDECLSLKSEVSALSRTVRNLQKSREVLVSEFAVERQALNEEIATAALKQKQKHSVKFEEYRRKARQLLEEKEKQVSAMRRRLQHTSEGSLSSPRFAEESSERFTDVSLVSDVLATGGLNVLNSADQSVQTPPWMLEALATMGSAPSKGATVSALPEIRELSAVPSQSLEQIMDDSKAMSALAQMQSAKELEIGEWKERVRRVQQMLVESQRRSQQLTKELEFARSEVQRMEAAKDVKKSADESEYLKNVLLSYFSGKIDANKMVTVVGAVLHFTADEMQRAKEHQSARAGGILPTVFDFGLFGS